jgi:hypothetical protein
MNGSGIDMITRNRAKVKVASKSSMLLKGEREKQEYIP